MKQNFSSGLSSSLGYFSHLNALNKSSIARQLEPSVRAQCTIIPTVHIIKSRDTQLFYPFAPVEPLALFSVVVGLSCFPSRIPLSWTNGVVGNRENLGLFSRGFLGLVRNFGFQFRKVPMGHLLSWALSGEVPTQFGAIYEHEIPKIGTCRPKFSIPFNLVLFLDFITCLHFSCGHVWIRLLFLFSVLLGFLSLVCFLDSERLSLCGS